MTAPFKREIEPRFKWLSGFIKESINLTAHQSHTPTVNKNAGSATQLSLQKFKIQAQFLIDRIQKTISRFEETDREWISFIHTRTGSALIEAKSDYSNFLLGQEGDRCHFRTLIERGRRAISSLEQALKDHLNCECNSAVSLPQQTDNASHHQPHQPIGEANVHTHTAHQASLNYGITTLQLPRVKPPIFSGDPLQWPSFWATFEVMVHSKPISNAEKMSYLVMFLRNDAKKAINGYHITNDNYPIVIDLLKRRFGNEKVIGEILQHDLISLSKATNATQSLRTFSDSVECLCRQMHSIQISDEQPILRTIIKSKLPVKILTKIVEQERAAGESWTTAKLRQAIQDIIDIRESAQRCTYVYRNASGNIQETSNQRCPNIDSITLIPSHTSEKTDLISFDANIVAVSQETSPKSEPAPTEIALVTEIISRLPRFETIDISLPEISNIIEPLIVEEDSNKASEPSHDLRPICHNSEQIHVQKHEETEEYITNQSPTNYAIQIHLNVRKGKIEKITLKFLYQPISAYAQSGTDNSVIKNLAGTNLRTLASYLLCQGKCVLCFTRLLCRCYHTHKESSCRQRNSQFVTQEEHFNAIRLAIILNLSSVLTTLAAAVLASGLALTLKDTQTHIGNEQILTQRNRGNPLGNQWLIPRSVSTSVRTPHQVNQSGPFQSHS